MICILFAGVYLLAAYIPGSKQLNMPFKGSKMAQELCIKAKEVHDTCFAQIKAEFEIDPKLWADFIDSYQEYVQNDDLLGSCQQDNDVSQFPIVTATKRILTEYGINPAKVALTLMDASDTPAQAIQEISSDDSQIMHRIELNIPWLTTYPMEIQEALIRHEIMHLIHYDSLEGSYVITMLYQSGYTKSECDSASSMIAYRHQRELRADALASADRPEVAQALHSFFQKFISVEDQENPALWLSHPSDKKRCNQLAQLLTQMDKPAVAQA